MLFVSEAPNENAVALVSAVTSLVGARTSHGSIRHDVDRPLAVDRCQRATDERAQSEAEPASAGSEAGGAALALQALTQTVICQDRSLLAPCELSTERCSGAHAPTGPTW